MALNRRELLITAGAIVVGGVGGKLSLPLSIVKRPDPPAYTLDEKARMLWAEYGENIPTKADGGRVFYRIISGGRELEEITAVRFWYLYVQALHGGKFENGASFFRKQAIKQLEGSFGDNPKMFKCLMAACGLNLYQGK